MDELGRATRDVDVHVKQVFNRGKGQSAASRAERNLPQRLKQKRCTSKCRTRCPTPCRHTMPPLPPRAQPLKRPKSSPPSFGVRSSARYFSSAIHDRLPAVGRARLPTRRREPVRSRPCARPRLPRSPQPVRDAAAAPPWPHWGLPQTSLQIDAVCFRCRTDRQTL